MMDSLFTNVGGKLKDFAKAYFKITTVLLILGGMVSLALITDNELLMKMMGWVALVPLLGVPLLIFANLVTCWALYAIGESAEAKTAAFAPAPAPVANYVPSQRPAPVANYVPPKHPAPAPVPVVRPTTTAYAETEACVFDEGDPLAEDAEFVDVVCPKCRENLSFVVGTKRGLCPECGAQFDLR